MEARYSLLIAQQEKLREELEEWISLLKAHQEIIFFGFEVYAGKCYVILVKAHESKYEDDFNRLIKRIKTSEESKDDDNAISTSRPCSSNTKEADAGEAEKEQKLEKELEERLLKKLEAKLEQTLEDRLNKANKNAEETTETPEDTPTGENDNPKNIIDTPSTSWLEKELEERLLKKLEAKLEQILEDRLNKANKNAEETTETPEDTPTGENDNPKNIIDTPSTSRVSSNEQAETKKEKGDEEKRKSFEKMWNPIDGTLTEQLVQQFAETMQSVGCFYSNVGKGTAFRVGTKYAMTAFHVISNIVCPYGKEDHSRLCPDRVGIKFSDHDRLFKLAGKLHYSNSDLDIAIVEFHEDCIKDLPTPLSLLHYELTDVNSDEVALIGHGHHGFKCVEPKVKVVNMENVPIEDICQYIDKQREDLKAMIGNKSCLVDDHYNALQKEHNILVNAHMQHGASGSPMLSKRDPTALKVIAVYTGGYPKFIYQLPKTVDYPIEWTFEAGTKTSFIYDDLQENHKELANDIFEMEEMNTD